MDELLHHCLRELSFDGDLGECLYHHHVMVATCVRVRTPSQPPFFLPLIAESMKIRLQRFSLERLRCWVLFSVRRTTHTKSRRRLLRFCVVINSAAANGFSRHDLARRFFGHLGGASD
jgi:hypothetical protein